MSKQRASTAQARIYFAPLEKYVSSDGADRTRAIHAPLRVTARQSRVTR